MILNEKLAKEAAEFANMAVVDDDHEWFVQRTFSAIDYYLKHRTLPERMRESAEVVREADQRCHGRIEGWTPADLEGTADAWEAEERAAIAELVEEFAKALHLARIVSGVEDPSDWEQCGEKYQRLRRVEARDLLKTFDVKRREVA